MACLCLLGHKPKKSLRKKLDSLSKEKSKDKGNAVQYVLHLGAMYSVFN